MGNPRQRKAKKEAAKLSANTSVLENDTLVTEAEVVAEEVIDVEEMLKEAAVESLKKTATANTKTSKKSVKNKKGTISLFGNKKEDN